MEQTGNAAAAVQLILSVVIAIALDWLPGFKTWWHPLEENQKRMYMAAFLLTSMILVAVGGCYLNNQCPADWMNYFWELVIIYFGGLAFNQGAHALFKPSEARLSNWLDG